MTTPSPNTTPQKYVELRLPAPTPQPWLKSTFNSVFLFYHTRCLNEKYIVWNSFMLLVYKGEKSRRVEEKKNEKFFYPELYSDGSPANLPSYPLGPRLRFIDVARLIWAIIRFSLSLHIALTRKCKTLHSVCTLLIWISREL